MAFLKQRGVILKKFPPSVNEPAKFIAPEVKPETKPYISALGFDISLANDNQDASQLFDATLPRFRDEVFKSFERIMLYAQDTKTTVAAFLHITATNRLYAVVPSINQLCSKMHIEDLSPIDKRDCNHDEIECQDNHFKDSSILIETDDYLKCSQSDAMFQVLKNTLFFLRGKKWVEIDVHPNLKDGFYTLNNKNF